ncbi:hypothetical protein CWE13_01585 [Aliidiomarina shirensis]|uniref:Uncharacterized protein n=1 Tax=Aliidiomarina shirensis TaxID=1048642 RepID=A0A432WX49_9GAMM|nr:hypothetical protein [Aliidiomarina shirensis]RUO38360.1 hypothetical protein CWE13_01585 [Aliidiomarina shirensis]
MENNNNNELRGSVENAVQSKQKLDINKVLQEAYETTKKKRTTLAGAIVWSFFILIAAGILVAVLAEFSGIEQESKAFTLITYALQVIIYFPLVGGIHLIALRTVIGKTPDINQAFEFLSKPWSLMAVGLITTVIVNAPTLIGFEHFTVLIWAAFFNISFVLAATIVATGAASPLNAVMLSFNLVIKRFLGFLILNIVIFIVTMLIIVPAVLLGLFAGTNGFMMVLTILAALAVLYLLFAWVVPTYFFAIAIYYRDLFQVKAVNENESDDLSGGEKEPVLAEENSADKPDSQSFNA